MLPNCQPIKNNKLHHLHLFLLIEVISLGTLLGRTSLLFTWGRPMVAECLQLVVIWFFRGFFLFVSDRKKSPTLSSNTFFGSVIHKHVNIFIFYAWYCLTNKYIQDHPIASNCHSDWDGMVTTNDWDQLFSLWMTWIPMVQWWFTIWVRVHIKYIDGSAIKWCCTNKTSISCFIVAT